jgi:hypothetical protein
MKQTTITLAEKQYTIKELPSRKNAEWKQLLLDKLVPLEKLGGMVKEVKLPENMTEFNELGGDGLIDVLKQVGHVVLNSFDDVRDLVISYSPELEKNREWLEYNAYDSEYLQALIEVVKVALPFGEIRGVMQALQNMSGLSKEPATLPN